MADLVPGADLRTAAKLLDQRIVAALEDLRTNSYFGHHPAGFRDGINGACGGAAGELAAMFNPEVATEMVRALNAHADEHDAGDCVWSCCPLAALACLLNEGDGNG